MKVYVFSLKAEKGIYAFTINNEYADLFRSQRNMNVFDEKVISMDKHEYKAFSYQMQSHQLCKDYLDDGEHDIEIISTIQETTSLSESCEYITQTIEMLEKNVQIYPFKKKYLKIIIKLTQCITKRNDDHPTLNVNTFALFYHLFRNTFSEYELPDSPNLKFLISYDDE